MDGNEPRPSLPGEPASTSELHQVFCESVTSIEACPAERVLIKAVTTAGAAVVILVTDGASLRRAVAEFEASTT